MSPVDWGRLQFHFTVKVTAAPQDPASCFCAIYRKRYESGSNLTVITITSDGVDWSKYSTYAQEGCQEDENTLINAKELNFKESPHEQPLPNL